MIRSTQRALLVIKDFVKAEALGAYVELLGYSVDIANESLKACKLMGKRCPYQLLITELIVDEISGLGLHMVAKKKNPLIKTIALNDGGDALRNIAENFGIEQVIDLPIDLNEG